MKKKIAIVFCVLFNLIFFSYQVKADNNEDKNLKKDFSIFLDKDTIAKGYTVSIFNDYLKLSLVPGILSADTQVVAEKIPDTDLELPWTLKKESSIIQFEFKNKEAYDSSRPFYIQMSYDESNNYYKQVFFYDKTHNLWRPLPTQDFPEENFVRSVIHLPYARLAVFSYPNLLSVGQASWYKYKGGNFAASPDFPAGSILRVYNLANNKYVDVTVNDYGPDRSIFPNRVIDLDAVAFSKIANKSDGIINISIEPLKIVNNKGSEPLVVDFGIGSQPVVDSASVVVLDELSGDILYEKNANIVRPIASLTKIFSVFNFLSNNKKSLDEIVSYSKQDEEYNFNYCPKWEVALINLSEGDLLSVKDLIYSSLVRSANNAVESLVRISGVERSTFIDQINSWAKEQGALTFNIKEPTGLDKNNISSALDLAILTSKVFKNSIISDASITKKYSFKKRNDNISILRYNSSDLVLNNNYKNFKITGSKTGYLDEAGYCLITEAEVKGRKVVVVILDSATRDKSFSETVDLLNYIFYKIK
ncbi:MAG TPA: RlpA-like double-psi beta-barrel domain-containing protein [bacterium]|nr:RlpA-like double-psi beta-barrel domain-containing protein [bacterium]